MSGVRRPWSDEDLQLLAELWRDGRSVRAIAENLGRSESAIAVRASRLNLGSRRSLAAPPPPELRECLMCGRKFPPLHRHNRVCKPCQASDEWRFGGRWYEIDGEVG